MSMNIENWTHNFGHIVNQDVIFGMLNFQILSLLQSQYIANIPKIISFSILGFFHLEVKLGFDFLGVIPNQKY